jgi:hypothetical protein
MREGAGGYDNYGDDGAGYSKRSRMNGDASKPKKHVRNSSSSKIPNASRANRCWPLAQSRPCSL